MQSQTFIYLILISLNLFVLVNSAHLLGSFDVSEFYTFLIKFGFQRTERHSQKDSFGYIYGNITSNDKFHHPVTLAVLDKHHFLEFYGNRSVEDDRGKQTLIDYVSPTQHLSLVSLCRCQMQNDVCKAECDCVR